MILSRRSNIAWLISFTILAFGLLGGFAFYFLNRASIMPPEQLKFIAERFLFFTIFACLVFLFFGFRIIFRSIRFSQSLDKLLSLSRSSGYSPDSGLRKLGSIGVQLADIFYEMNRLSEKKSLKIGALNSLCDHLTEMMIQKVVVVTATGTILYVSRNLLEDSNLPRLDFVGKQAEDLFPDYAIKKSLEEVFTSRLESPLQSGKGTVIPVLNYKKETSYAICIFQQGLKLNVITALTASSPSGKKVKTGMNRILNSLRRPGKKMD